MKAALYPNFQKKNALECAKRVCGILIKAGITVSVSKDFENEFISEFSDGVKVEDIESAAADSVFVIAIGGDGTLLRCAKKLIGYDTKLLGINTGRLGFMASLESDEIEKLDMLKHGVYKVSERMLLSGMLRTSADGKDVARKYVALNDICVHTSHCKSGDFAVYADDFLIGKYRADGVLMSTPTGSTAYALSAGGPVIEPEMECISMTMICPHTFFSRPMIFSPERTLRILNISDKNHVYLSADGEEPMRFMPGDTLEIRKSIHKIKLINITGSSFHESLGKKLMRSIK